MGCRFFCLHATRYQAGVSLPHADGRIKLVYVIAYEMRWPMIEWVCRLLDRDRFDLSFILLHKSVSPLAAVLDEMGIPHTTLRCRRRFDVWRLAAGIYRWCRRHRPAILHAHFTNACLAGLPAARLAGVPVRLHTRHHAGPYPRSHREPWGVLYDRFHNRLSTGIIAPCEGTRRVLVDHDGARPEHVVTIHHGFDLAAFAEVPVARVAGLRERYGIRGPGPIIGMASRYEEIKGIHYVIPAFKRLLAAHPDAKLVLANARGKFSETIARLLSELPAGSFSEVPFEPDMFALYQTFDLFVHVPVEAETEGFGQVYIEAMAAGVPSIFTRSGIAGDVARHQENCWVVDFRDSEGIHRAMHTILGDPAMAARLVANGRHTAAGFGLEPMVGALEAYYRAAVAAINRGPA